MTQAERELLERLSGRDFTLYFRDMPAFRGLRAAGLAQLDARGFVELTPAGKLEADKLERCDYTDCGQLAIAGGGNGLAWCARHEPCACGEFLTAEHETVEADSEQHGRRSCYIKDASGRAMLASRQAVAR